MCFLYEATDGFDLNGFRGDYALGVSFPVTGFPRVSLKCLVLTGLVKAHHPFMTHSQIGMSHELVS